MTRTSAPSLREPWGSKLVVSTALGAILVLLCSGCGHSTSESLQRDDSSRPLFPVAIGGTMGFIDDLGKLVIPSHYEAALPFSEGLAAAKHEGRWEYINRSGAEAIPYRYRTAESFHGGVAIVNTGLPDHPVGVIDPNGAWVTQPIFRSLAAADGPNGLLLGQKEPGGGPSFYDRAGNLVLGPYLLAFPFSQGRARVKDGRNEWVIDPAGNFISKQPVVLDGIGFSEGLIAVRRDGKLGYMDPYGNIAIEPRYDQGGAFSEGLAPVQLDGNWVFIDKSGATVAKLPGEVVFAEPLSEGFSLVTAVVARPEKKFGYVDKKGQWAVKPTWDDAQPFHDGLAYVGIWKNQVAAYIDHKGKHIWEGRAASQ